jgi:hypothetical protein
MIKLKIGTLLLILFIIFTNLPSSTSAEIVFEDNFDSLPDWEPISSSECVEGDCSSQVPDNWSYYRSMGTFNSDTIPVGRNTISISNEHYKGVSG